MGEHSDASTQEPHTPKLEVTGGWFVFPLRRIPLFVWIFLPFFAAGWLLISLANGQFPVDPRFYGTWDVFIDGERRNMWTMSPPGLFGAKLKDEQEGRIEQWGVKDEKFIYGIGYGTRHSIGLRDYRIAEVSDDRILLERGKKSVELRRRK